MLDTNLLSINLHEYFYIYVFPERLFANIGIWSWHSYCVLAVGEQVIVRSPIDPENNPDPDPNGEPGANCTTVDYGGISEPQLEVRNSVLVLILP